MDVEEGQSHIPSPGEDDAIVVEVVNGPTGGREAKELESGCEGVSKIAEHTSTPPPFPSSPPIKH